MATWTANVIFFTVCPATRNSQLPSWSSTFNARGILESSCVDSRNRRIREPKWGDRGRNLQECLSHTKLGWQHRANSSVYSWLHAKGILSDSLFYHAKSYEGYFLFSGTLRSVWPLLVFTFEYISTGLLYDVPTRLEQRQSSLVKIKPFTTQGWPSRIQNIQAYRLRFV